jgi:hypothetical protein
MKLYKFMCLEPFERAADALLGKRLYCPTPDQLNDPLEGFLGNVSQQTDAPQTLESQLEAGYRTLFDTKRELSKVRVCCFSGRPDSYQMWSYYAGGHKGLCFELEMSQYARQIVRIEYVDDIAKLSSKTPIERLSFKHLNWSHEEEYRLIIPNDSQRKFLPVQIESVLIGAGTDGRFLLPLFELCRRIGLSREIASFSTQGKFVRLKLRQDVHFLDRLRDDDDVGSS